MIESKIEIRVRPVTRYVVTVYAQGHLHGEGYTHSTSYGEFANECQAHRVAEAMGKQEAADSPGFKIVYDKITFGAPRQPDPAA